MFGAIDLSVPPQPGAIDLYPPSHKGTFSVLLDHFRFVEPVLSFSLRYAAYTAFASNRSTAPVLFYCGNEGALELFYNASGGLFEHARALRATVFFVEHRYYGESLPFGSDKSFTTEGLQWLTVEQALADYTQVIAALPGLLGCAGTGPRKAAILCDVVLWGGSYGGMLAAWHRLKFPSLSVGAIASGAPIDFYPAAFGSDAGRSHVQAAFLAAVVSTFDTYGGSRVATAGEGREDMGCGQAMLAALTAADSATPSELSEAGVRSCHPWRADSPERYAFYARGALADIALVDYPYPTNFIAPLPANPVRAACRRLLAAPLSNRHSMLRSLHAAVLGLVNASRDLRCVDLRAELVGQPNSTDAPRGGAIRGGAVGSSALGVVAWNYQACTELPLEPLTSDGFGFFPPSDAQLAETAALCRERFGVAPRPGWLALTFGRAAAFAQASNIVFAENDKDPWHVGTRTVPPEGGVNGSVVRFVATGGAHHQDLRFSSPYDAPDVHRARAYERRAIQKWLLM